MRSARAERGQATVEVVALWLIMAVIAGLLVLGLPALGPFVARALDRDPSPRRRASRPPPGWPSRRSPAAPAAAARPPCSWPSGCWRSSSAPAVPRTTSRSACWPGTASRLGRAIDATSIVGGAQAPGDQLIATAAGRPVVTIARLADEPVPDLDAATRRAVIAAGKDAAISGLELVPRAAPLGKLLGRVQAGQAIVGLLAPPATSARSPGRRAGDAVLCAPVDLRWTMNGHVHVRPLARALHLVVVRAGRVIDERLVDGERCP